MKSLYTTTLAVLGLQIALASSNAFAIDCHGTEPFWGAEITEEGVTLSIAGDESAQLIPVSQKSAASGFQSEFLQVFSNDNGPVAVVTSNQCDNSMSDETFPKEVIIFTGTTTLYGCCGKGTPAGEGI